MKFTPPAQVRKDRETIVTQSQNRHKSSVLSSTKSTTQPCVSSSISPTLNSSVLSPTDKLSSDNPPPIAEESSTKAKETTGQAADRSEWITPADVKQEKEERWASQSRNTALPKSSTRLSSPTLSSSPHINGSTNQTSITDTKPRGTSTKSTKEEVSPETFPTNGNVIQESSVEQENKTCNTISTKGSNVSTLPSTSQSIPPTQSTKVSSTTAQTNSNKRVSFSSPPVNGSTTYQVPPNDNRIDFSLYGDAYSSYQGPPTKRYRSSSAQSSIASSLYHHHGGDKKEGGVMYPSDYISAIPYTATSTRPSVHPPSSNGQDLVTFYRPSPGIKEWWGTTACIAVFKHMEMIETMHYDTTVVVNVFEGTLHIVGPDYDKINLTLESCKQIALDDLKKRRLGRKHCHMSKEELLIEAREIYLESLAIRGQEFKQAADDTIDFFLQQGVSDEEAVNLYKDMVWEWAGTVVYAVERRKGGVGKSLWTSYPCFDIDTSHPLYIHNII